MDESGFTIVLTPAQLAATISGGTLDGSTSNWTRLWGGVKLVFGAFEELGASALLLAPEPTTATKFAGVALGVHGVDTMQSGSRQLMAGRETRTNMSEGTAALARSLGVSEESARQIGEGVDMAVPVALTLGLGAARLAAVRSGRIVLAEHEAQAGARIGGHTIARHVGQTDAQLASRLASTKLARVSTFSSIPEAEQAISLAMRSQRSAITAWARTAALGDKKDFVAAAAKGGVGRVLVRGAASPVPGKAVLFVLKKEPYNGLLFYLLTAYPQP